VFLKKGSSIELAGYYPQYSESAVDLTSRVQLPTCLIFQAGLNSYHLPIQSKTRILFLEVNHPGLKAHYCHLHLMWRLKMHGVGCNSRQGKIFQSSFICMYSRRNVDMGLIIVDEKLCCHGVPDIVCWPLLSTGMSCMSERDFLGVIQKGLEYWQNGLEHVVSNVNCLLLPNNRLFSIKCPTTCHRSTIIKVQILTWIRQVPSIPFHFTLSIATLLYSAVNSFYCY